MKNVKRGLIEYIGIEKCPIKNKKNFNQINIEQIVCIPNQKPDMEQINTVSVKGLVTDYEIVNTPIGSSIEGQIMTGYKLLVCGDIKIKVKYIACEPTQTVHTAHFCFPFCNYLVLPSDFNPNIKINPSILIEDIFSDQLDNKCIYNNITILLIADI
ncbi:SPOCS domain-containing protein [Clostridium weizhouense]|uniref:DUF3794 domain-containing protein n=1 Tax=Clostridium weizhouense TaxID=2859781 RepID=A0ABS7ANB3_9CLOT|nr:SPOCS domain-containing protein [Clostridium weizhouense]MBW6410129.1 DUF3794 domain-containing protein [Clostridium weizhouense]